MNRFASLLCSLLMVGFVAGCGSDKKNEPSNADLDAKTLAMNAKTALEGASSFQVDADGKSDGDTIKITARYGADSAEAKVQFGDQTADLRRVGSDVFLKGSDDFWRELVPPAKVAQVLPLVSGKWVQAPAGNEKFAELGNFLDKKTFTSELTSDSDPTTFTKGEAKKINGVDTVSFVDPSAEGSTVYVQAKGDAFPVQVVSKPDADGDGGTINFSKYNESFKVEKPAAGEIFDITPYL